MRLREELRRAPEDSRLRVGPRPPVPHDRLADLDRHLVPVVRRRKVTVHRAAQAEGMPLRVELPEVHEHVQLRDALAVGNPCSDDLPLIAVRVLARVLRPVGVRIAARHEQHQLAKLLDHPHLEALAAFRNPARPEEQPRALRPHAPLGLGAQRHGGERLEDVHRPTAPAPAVAPQPAVEVHLLVDQLVKRPQEGDVVHPRVGGAERAVLLQHDEVPGAVLGGRAVGRQSARLLELLDKIAALVLRVPRRVALDLQQPRRREAVLLHRRLENRRTVLCALV
mmetsp:Transcript_19801/g.64805  ORF Transcript_19801/g.64805 Transcript_19801/m.64805 type:complete len:281 (-) Transcript_19801:2089-2931(-)